MPKKNKYRSGFEKKFAAYLTSLKVLFGYEEKKHTYIIEHKYIEDFTLPNQIIIEVKGYFTSKDRTKHLALKKQHPELDIRFLFQADNFLSKKSKTRYSEWALSKGFKYVISKEAKIPKDWIKEK